MYYADILANPKKARGSPSKTLEERLSDALETETRKLGERLRRCVKTDDDLTMVVDRLNQFLRVVTTELDSRCEGTGTQPLFLSVVGM